MQTLWLQKVLTKEILLPSKEVMLGRVKEEKIQSHSWIPLTISDAALFQKHKTEYYNQLCQDMGMKSNLKRWNLLAEAFTPCHTSDYEGLMGKT